MSLGFKWLTEFNRLSRNLVKAVVYVVTPGFSEGSQIPGSRVSGCDVDDEENTRVAMTPEFTWPCDTRPTRQYSLQTGYSSRKMSLF